jgi:hypothetical protein
MSEVPQLAHSEGSSEKEKAAKAEHQQKRA